MTKPYVQSGEPLHEFLRSFWQRQVDAAEQETPDYRHPPLPLARIKKVMKNDPDVKMIAADGQSFPRRSACEIFIAEITARAFIIADSNKRRTLSRSDIAKALNKSDQFDFLIDIVPREEPFASASAGRSAVKKNPSGSSSKRDGRHGNGQQGESHGEHLELERNPSGHGNMPPTAVLDQLQSLLHSPAPMERPSMS
ncbi:hypothetical protein EW146_g267 [Bondarzewia mesenterica]|uniref:Transcription factor CBF/NF-Y/archaeal histone domain-containing protein n=1 Tax=Bondarzewia mesenterica TaxID=1095465 RepID=A0A4S4M7K8_9AGAM|nr:hypothetical protein EW146_g267 [Bondarzewia mesenterica]